MLALHGGSRSHYYLNGPVVVTACATWERFINDLIGAGRRDADDWHPLDHAADIGGGAAPWPASTADRKRFEKTGRHELDFQMIDVGILTSNLTSRWTLTLSTSWMRGQPTEWVAIEPTGDGGSLDPTLARHILGAKSARDAVAHRLYFKKARTANNEDQDGTPTRSTA